MRYNGLSWLTAKGPRDSDMEYKYRASISGIEILFLGTHLLFGHLDPEGEGIAYLGMGVVRSDLGSSPQD